MDIDLPVLAGGRRDRTIVIVTWADAVIHSDGDTKAKHEPSVQVTIGWLLKHDDKGLSLICEYERDSPNEWRAENFIPEGMIVGVEELEYVSYD